MLSFHDVINALHLKSIKVSKKDAIVILSYISSKVERLWNEDTEMVQKIKSLPMFIMINGIRTDLRSVKFVAKDGGCPYNGLRELMEGLGLGVLSFQKERTSPINEFS